MLLLVDEDWFTARLACLSFIKCYGAAVQKDRLPFQKGKLLIHESEWFFIFDKVSSSLSDASMNIKSYSLSDYDYKILKELKTVDNDLKKECALDDLQAHETKNNSANETEQQNKGIRLIHNNSEALS